MTNGHIEGLLQFTDERQDGQLRDPLHPLRPAKGNLVVQRCTECSLLRGSIGAWRLAALPEFAKGSEFVRRHIAPLYGLLLAPFIGFGVAFVLAPLIARGFGVQLEVQAGTAAISVSGYADDGNPQWLFGAAPAKRKAKGKAAQASKAAPAETPTPPCTTCGWRRTRPPPGRASR